jgi:predicted lysophospholipase L1 biosynthesis ABC-type transport system permease subunit
MTSAVSPPVVSNLDLVDQAPYLLAGYLALLGVAASAHAIVTLVRSRRTEMATLRGLGFERRQVRTTVVAHALTVAAIGGVVGLPLGLAVGRLAWRLVAGGLGFATDPRNPTVALLATPPGALALAAAIALGPALWAARQRPGTILRTE